MCHVYVPRPLSLYAVLRPNPFTFMCSLYGLAREPDVSLCLLCMYHCSFQCLLYLTVLCNDTNTSTTVRLSNRYSFVDCSTFEIHLFAYIYVGLAFVNIFAVDWFVRIRCCGQLPGLWQVLLRLFCFSPFCNILQHSAVLCIAGIKLL